jgi:hypothetical protein
MFTGWKRPEGGMKVRAENMRVSDRCEPTLGYLGDGDSRAFLLNTYFTSVVHNVTGQLQEPMDLMRPATAEIVFTIL